MNTTTRRRLALCLLMAAGPAAAQIPETFTNLQVIRKDISPTELVAAMRNIAGDLGVRCAHCHVGPDDLTGMDFASDQKATKVAARAMLRLVDAINKDLAEKLPAAPEPRASVACETCHRGLPRPPRPLTDELMAAARQGGAGAATSRLTELWEQHGTAGRYDFRPQEIGFAVRRLGQAGLWDEALALAQANIERHPKSAVPHVVLGRLLIQKGDRAAAAARFGRALELDPQSPEARRGLAEAQATPSPSPMK